MRICTEFVAAVHRLSMAMMDNIMTMDETMVSYNTPQTKRQSKQWIKKGLPGPVKAKVAASRTKQMLVAFFDKKGLVSMHIVLRGTTINANYTIIVLGKFMKHLRIKRPEMVEQEWFLHWDRPHRRRCQELAGRQRDPVVAAPPPIRLISCQRTSSCSER